MAAAFVRESACHPESEWRADAPFGKATSIVRIALPVCTIVQRKQSKSQAGTPSQRGGITIRPLRSTTLPPRNEHSRSISVYHAHSTFSRPRTVCSSDADVTRLSSSVVDNRQCNVNAVHEVRMESTPETVSIGGQSAT